MGVVRVEARTNAPEAEIYQLLTELQDDDSIHPWKSLSLNSPVDLYKKLLNFENHKRPTEIFFYYSVNAGGGQELLGVGTVARKIRHDFPHEGYPLVGRCYVREKFRNFRIYYPMLQHRFEYCQRLFGDRLRAVYFGSPNARIYNVIKRDIFGIPLLYVGDEELIQNLQNKETAYIKNYIWMTPEIRHELLTVEKTMAGSNAAFNKLVYTVKKLLANELTDKDFGQLKSYIHQVEGQLGWSPRAIPGFRELIDTCDGIGIMFKEKTIKDDLPAVNRRKKKAA
jgi:hypothetical protein